MTAHHGHELHAERPGEVMLPLGPVEALARKTAPRRPHGANVEPDAREPLVPVRRHVELLVFGLDQRAAAHERLRHRHAHLPREVVVAAACKT